MLNKSLNKSKGFTLIELLVVIAIISLLSAIVLASIKSAREKAQITKTVAEMKSLQTALELYKNQFGRYPGELEYTNYDDDTNCAFTCGFWSLGDMHSFFTTELVNRKMLTKVPHAPNYPNNCLTDCSSNGYVLGYSIYDSFFTGYLHKDNNTSDYFVCGDQRVKNYVIYFGANNKKLNLPILGIWSGGIYYNIPDGMGYPPGNVYCLSM